MWGNAAAMGAFRLSCVDLGLNSWTRDAQLFKAPF